MPTDDEYILPENNGNPEYYMSNGSGLLVETPLGSSWASLTAVTEHRYLDGFDIWVGIMLQQMVLQISGLLGTTAGATTITVDTTGEIDL